MTRLVPVRALCDACRRAPATFFCPSARRALCATCRASAPNAVDIAHALTGLPFCGRCDAAPAYSFCPERDSALCSSCDARTRGAAYAQRPTALRRRAIGVAVKERSVRLETGGCSRPPPAPPRPTMGDMARAPATPVDLGVAHCGPDQGGFAAPFGPQAVMAGGWASVSPLQMLAHTPGTAGSYHSLRTGMESARGGEAGGGFGAPQGVGGLGYSSPNPVALAPVLRKRQRSFLEPRKSQDGLSSGLGLRAMQDMDDVETGGVCGTDCREGSGGSGSGPGSAVASDEFDTDDRGNSTDVSGSSRRSGAQLASLYDSAAMAAAVTSAAEMYLLSSAERTMGMSLTEAALSRPPADLNPMDLHKLATSAAAGAMAAVSGMACQSRRGIKRQSPDTPSPRPERVVDVHAEWRREGDDFEMTPPGSSIEFSSSGRSLPVTDARSAALPVLPTRLSRVAGSPIGKSGYARGDDVMPELNEFENNLDFGQMFGFGASNAGNYCGDLRGGQSL